MFRLRAFVFIYFHFVLVQCDEYQGSYLGKFNTYAHQATGEVYAIDEYTFLIKNFFYDGLGQDAYFWAGATVRPSNIGFIIPDEKGKTNKLRQYVNKDITIRIPDDKKIKVIKWLAVWDIRDKRNYADIYIPDGFQSPAPQEISEFSRYSHNVKSGPVVIVDSKTIKIPDFSYDGLSKSAYFWVGSGPQPNSAGKKIPNERGYLDPIGSYEDETLILALPGEMSIFDIDFLAVWDDETNENFGSVIIPDDLNIPPSLNEIIKHETRMPNCEQLHQKLQLNWEIFGPQITFEIVGQIDKNDYIAFGISGSKNSSQMIGSDVALSYMDGHLGVTQDYNITGKFPCTNILGMYKGVCLDTKVGGVDNYQIHLFERVDSLTKITFRRNLINTGDEGDQIYEKSGNTYIVWAIGKYNAIREPNFHHIYPKGNIKIEFGRKSEKNCHHFIRPKEPNTYSGISSPKAWGPLKLFNRTLTTFYARIGDAGGMKGYYGSTGGTASPGIVWYINGLLAPVLYVKRGRTYNFRVEGGNNPYNAHLYHPLYITNDPNGGFIEYSEQERKKYQIFSGIEFDKKGRPTPTSAGRLCVWLSSDNLDKRKADNFHSFIQYRSALNYTCEEGNAAILQWTPNSSTPDLVYYQSYTHRNMGYKIVVLDDFTNSIQSTAQSLGISLFLIIAYIFMIGFDCNSILHNL